ncbi:MAG: DUF3570 domain-containing protein [Kofleriaceae bacterium]
MSGLSARVLAAGLVIAALATNAMADDYAEVSTTLFAERRDGGEGGLMVIHPQLDFGIDLGRFITLDASYAADAVSGATSVVYQVDAISTATSFSDFRSEGTVGFGVHGRRSRLAVSGTFGTERDYLTRQIGGAASVDLPGRNTTIGLAYRHSFDRVCNRDNALVAPLEAKALIGDDPCDKRSVMFGKDHIDPTTGMRLTTWSPLRIDRAQATLTQNLSPVMNMQVALFGEVLEGFQSNPYRRVRIGPNAPQEHIPDTRARWSISARLNRYFPKLKGAVHFDGRFYDDTWRVVAGNLELAYSQYAGKSLLFRFHTRIYQQTAAKFFKDAFYYQTESTAGEYFTGDRELSPVRNVAVGAKLTMITVGEDHPVWGLFDKLQLNLRGEALLLDVLPANSLENNPEGIDAQFNYGNKFIDSVTVQLGLLGNY